MSRVRPHSLSARVAGLFAVSLTLASCSSRSSEGKREYTVPSSLCGTAASASALEPLLPAGKRISSVKSGPIGLTRCRLMLDGQVVVTSVTEQWEPGTTLSDVAYTAYRLPAGSVKKESARYVVSDSVGVRHASCGKLQKEGHEIFTMIRKEHTARSVRRPWMRPS
jgi:hypothetical protein